MLLLPSHIDPRHADVRKDDADEDGADGGDEALELRRDRVDAATTRQHAPPAARARLLPAADQCDGWEDGGNGRDEKTPPPTPRLRRYMAWPAYLKYETHLAGTAEGSRAGRAQKWHSLHSQFSYKQLGDLRWQIDPWEP